MKQYKINHWGNIQKQNKQNRHLSNHKKDSAFFFNVRFGTAKLRYKLSRSMASGCALAILNKHICVLIKS